MKTIMMTLLLLTTGAFAQDYEIEKVSFKTSIYVYNLSCVTLVGQQDSIFTELRQKFKKGFHSSILLKHDEPQGLDCNRSALNQLLEDSQDYFGHVQAKVTVIKETTKVPRMVFGKCQRNYNEKLTFELDYGIILKTSKVGILIPATGCN